MNWQPIDTYREKTRPIVEDILLWDGKYVYVGWLGDDGWYRLCGVDYGAEPEEPQPTHWMPFPEGPAGKV